MPRSDARRPACCSLGGRRTGGSARAGLGCLCPGCGGLCATAARDRNTARAGGVNIRSGGRPTALRDAAAGGPGSAPFTTAQTDWIRAALGDAVGASLTAFAHHVQADVEELRTEISTVRFEAAEAAARIERLDVSTSATAAMAQKAASDAADTRKALADLTARLGNTGSRAVARIGNIGWDTEPQTLQLRGAELLRLAGVPPTSHGPVAPVVGARGTGSMAEVAFCDAAS